MPEQTHEERFDAGDVAFASPDDVHRAYRREHDSAHYTPMDAIPRKNTDESREMHMGAERAIQSLVELVGIYGFTLTSDGDERGLNFRLTDPMTGIEYRLSDYRQTDSTTRCHVGAKTPDGEVMDAAISPSSLVDGVTTLCKTALENRKRMQDAVNSGDV